MARPILPTPTLRGNDAKEFLKDLEKNRPTPEVYKILERCERIYEFFQAKLARHGYKPC